VRIPSQHDNGGRVAERVVNLPSDLGSAELLVMFIVYDEDIGAKAAAREPNRFRSRGSAAHHVTL
jgi:hypothetical protein